MSLTWPVLDRAKQLLWVIGGESKVGAVRQFLDNDPSIPATLPPKPAPRSSSTKPPTPTDPGAVSLLGVCTLIRDEFF